MAKKKKEKKVGKMTFFCGLSLGSNKVHMWKLPVHSLVPWEVVEHSRGRALWGP